MGQQERTGQRAQEGHAPQPQRTPTLSRQFTSVGPRTTEAAGGQPDAVGNRRRDGGMAERKKHWKSEKRPRARDRVDSPRGQPCEEDGHGLPNSHPSPLRTHIGPRPSKTPTDHESRSRKHRAGERSSPVPPRARASPLPAAAIYLGALTTSSRMCSK